MLDKCWNSRCRTAWCWVCLLPPYYGNLNWSLRLTSSSVFLFSLNNSQFPQLPRYFQCHIGTEHLSQILFLFNERRWKLINDYDGQSYMLSEGPSLKGSLLPSENVVGTSQQHVWVVFLWFTQTVHFFGWHTWMIICGYHIILVVAYKSSGNVGSWLHQSLCGVEWTYWVLSLLSVLFFLLSLCQMCT